jgi:hypothetical protein
VSSFMQMVLLDSYGLDLLGATFDILYATISGLVHSCLAPASNFVALYFSIGILHWCYVCKHLLSCRIVPASDMLCKNLQLSTCESPAPTRVHYSL